MKGFLQKIFTCGSITLWSVSLFLAAATLLTAAAPLKEARVSQIIQDVRLLEQHGAPRPAMVNDQITVQRAVRTGKESRAELTFTDLTITRLGANTIFSLKAGAREIDLTSGTILLAVPSGAAPVRANTTAVTAAVTGGTALLGTGPPTKFMVLEGTGTIYPLGHPEKAVTVHGGEMVIAEGGRVSKPEQFDVKLVMETSLLIVDFPPLPNLSLIQDVINQQLAEQPPFWTIAWPPAWYWNDVLDVIDQDANTNPIVLRVRVGTPTPTPSKTGTPSTITSPNPYLITSGTVITTDPSITTNGVTDFGKIYRGPLQDGAFTLWAFDSTSAFDNAIGLDAIFAEIGNLPLAAFKFQSLSLVGNPTIDTTNGVTHLALIGVDGITSGPPGGMLTFTGIDALLLATVNGSINLTSDVSFRGLSLLSMYARGAGSNLTLDSPISNIGVLALAAENSIRLTNPSTMSVGAFEATAGNDLRLQIGGSLLFNGPVDLSTLVLPDTARASGANLTLNVTGDYTNNSATDSSRLRVRNGSAHIGTGGNIGVNIGGNLTAMNDFNLVVQNTNGRIDDGGDITLVTGRSISTVGELNLLVENYDETASPAGHIGTGGNLSLTTGGDLTADFASIAINNRGGGVINSGVNLTINVGGALTTQEDGPDFLGNTESLSIAISSRYDNGTAGSFIGGDANLRFHSDSASIGGMLSVNISDRGGTIDGNALLNFSVTHDMTVQENATWDILNDSGNAMNADSPIGGTIHGSATLRLSATDLTVTAGSLNVDILNKNGGVPDSGGGTIDSDAAIMVDLSGDLRTAGNAFFSIANQNDGGTSGGDIRGNAAITVSAANISTGTTLEATIDNTSGRIGGNATVSMNVSGSASVTNDATVAIFGSDRAASAAININGGSYDVGGTFLSSIDGNGTMTFNNATAHADVLKAGVFGANGVLNIGGGMLSADTELKLYAPGSNGQLNFVSNVTLGGNSLKILAADSVTIFNNVVVTIGGPNPADVFTNHANYTGFGGNGTTTGTFAGAGTNRPQPLANAPPFGPVSRSVLPHRPTSLSQPARVRDTNTPKTINVRNTDELLALLNDAHPEAGGKITIPAPKSTHDLKNSTRLNTERVLTANRSAMDMRRTMDIQRVAALRPDRLPQ